MKKLIVSCCFLLLSYPSFVFAQENLPVAKPAAKPVSAQQYSYAIGLNLGQDFHDLGVELDAKSLVAGLQAGLAGNKVKPQYDQATLMAAMQQLQQLMQEKSKCDNSRKLRRTKKWVNSFWLKIGSSLE